MQLGLWMVSIEDGKELFLRNLPITTEIEKTLPDSINLKDYLGKIQKCIGVKSIAEAY
ncbi:MAG: hypothetical protein AAF806_08355 [Bacteroidota bacterium]